ncbi:hypothetical protein [Nocardiopsis sp. NRRL B-16309]|uniref:hypothetical protein n=1 Tax=Nocardiopsis sp. NRRL B-16309 TaxID=1519494 RepID=UPI000A5E93CF|nr:hypothetical protein [Nocardiopsis sp. NRRL B-16309]
MPDRLAILAVHYALAISLALALTLTVVADDPHAPPAPGCLRARTACVEALDAVPGALRCAGGRRGGRARARSRSRCARARTTGGGRRDGRGGARRAVWSTPPRCRHRGVSW